LSGAAGDPLPSPAGYRGEGGAGLEVGAAGEGATGEGAEGGGPADREGEEPPDEVFAPPPDQLPFWELDGADEAAWTVVVRELAVLAELWPAAEVWADRARPLRSAASAAP